MNWTWFGKKCHGLTEVLPRYYPDGTEENYEKPQSGQLMSQPRQIQTEHLMNTSPEHYYYTNMLGALQFLIGILIL
jgi:hypothetical protein